MIAITAVKDRVQGTSRLAAVLGFYALIFCFELGDFLQWSSANFIIGIISIPFILDGNADRKTSARYAYVAAAFAVLYLLLPVKTFLYFTVAAALISLWEGIKGKAPILLPLTLILMAPITQYFADAFSFPLRLRLTSIAGYLMTLMGRQVAVEGNVITWNGVDFSVDPACMGIHMLLSSLLCAIMVLAVQQKRQSKQLRVWLVLLVLTGTLLLNVLANIIRILLLVQFRIMPDTAMHELVGIVCLVIYVLLPLVAACRWLIAAYGTERSRQSGEQRRVNYGAHAFIAILIAVGIVMAPVLHKRAPTSLPVISGYAASHYDADIVKLQAEHSLVYLKNLKGFYSSEHSPLMCWIGEGYTFQQVSETRLSGIAVVSGVLKKGNIVLYTAWWYSNGKSATSSSIDWRWDAMRHGTPYSIINVTTTSKQALIQQIANLIRNSTLNHWIDRTGRI
jgi:exosortase N